ncbi:calcitonin gene-related peptide 2 [Syngnathoides biaculeatus]|uniref:calcitonin gene-related peptide 2 n=1 Tax=Syngnathoides biaculeatus TaxID=300417 RepID=UPI002ADE86B4|nr:calcitonin gene-related peptide 2 [Syngnathoides biaculeatus]XP_061663395.1 calcitonin gene-related peptide 2 [Syngnathoides biaculeatus]XP_061663397.1 calcitonin gene-related peptide 2 [Syngnathoides biaculeatus]XP_061663398.1 calcitonin gene-related peptide 2 [Syngnathoides biaculeatus]
MYHPRVAALVLLLSILLRCIAAAPSNRPSSSSSFSDEESALSDGQEWSLPMFPFSNPFLGLMATRSQRGDTNSHSIQKRKCNTATCVTQRLADFLVRSSNTIGTVYAPTNVGSATYGKRGLLLPPNYYLPL